MPDKLPPLPEEFLVAEFEYIANSAFQANEDRSKAASFFLVAVGSLVAAIFGARQLEEFANDPRTVPFILSGLFALLTLMGTLTIAQLARLRLAWHGAALAMNHMKDFYKTHYKGRLDKAFLWDSKSIPTKFKWNSISFYTALEVTLVSALTAGAVAFYLQKGLTCVTWLWWITIGAGATVGSMQMIWYWYLLTKEEEKKQEKKEESHDNISQRHGRVPRERRGTRGKDQANST